MQPERTCTTPAARRGGRRRPLFAALTLACLAALWLPGSSAGDLEQDLSARRATAADLRAAIAAERRQIDATAAGVRDAQARLATLQADVEARQAELEALQQQVVRARDRLTQLENRLQRAGRKLAANLVQSYKDPEPDVISVILESHGYSDLLEQLEFMERVQRHNARILSDTRTSRARVLAQTAQLQRLIERTRELTGEVVRARNAAAAVESALLMRQAEQLRRQASTEARLDAVRGQISSLQTRIARLRNPVVTDVVRGLPVDAGGLAQAPAGAPGAVQQVIAAGNAIAGLPYAYGGGHGSFRADAYDCSGSISYALAAAGLLSSPLDSTGFMSWGEAGPGKWITVYANAGHAFMVVAGWRFDTSALGEESTRWSRSMRDTGGFVARHPAGL